MTLRQWLHTALRGLDPGERARLEPEYTAHFEDAQDASGSAAVAFSALGDPAALNLHLRQEYLTMEEIQFLDQRVAWISRPGRAWGLPAVAAGVVLALHNASGLLYGLSVLAMLLVRWLSLKYTSSRRAALAVTFAALPMFMVVMGGSLPPDHGALLFYLLRVMVGGPVVWALACFVRPRVWQKVWRYS